MAKGKAQVQFPGVTEIVTREILRWGGGLNAQAFSGTTNPKTLWQSFVAGRTDVFRHYREIEEKDTTIASALETRKLLVLARDWEISSADDANNQAAEFKDETARFLSSIPQFSFALEELLDAPAFGYSVLEILWKLEASMVGISQLVGRPQEYFRFAENLGDPEMGDLRFLPNLIGPGELVAPAKFLVHSYRPRHGDRRGVPLLRRLFWPSWFKRQCLRLNLQFAEKGQGTVAVEYPSSAGDAEKTKALDVAQGIVEEMAVAIPAGLKVMEPLLANARTRHAEDYQSLISYLDLEMTRMILGQTLTTRGSEEGRGTQALGRVHENLLYEIVKRDAKSIDDTINEQLIAPWGVWTFGERFLDRALRPTFQISLMPEEDALDQARLLQMARGLVDVPLEEAYRRLQIRQPEEDEALVRQSMIPVELTGFGGPEEGEIHG